MTRIHLVWLKSAVPKTIIILLRFVRVLNNSNNNTATVSHESLRWTSIVTQNMCIWVILRNWVPHCWWLLCYIVNDVAFVLEGSVSNNQCSLPMLIMLAVPHRSSISHNMHPNYASMIMWESENRPVCIMTTYNYHNAFFNMFYCKEQ